MSDGRCATCKLWEHPRTDFHQVIGNYNWDEDELTEEQKQAIAADIQYGKCSMPAFSPEGIPDPLPPAITKDGSDYMADLFTLGTFGCTEWTPEDEG